MNFSILRLLAFIVLFWVCVPAKSQALNPIILCPAEAVTAWNRCVGAATLENGNRYEGAWINGKPHGWGAEYDAAGVKVREGYWAEGRLGREVRPQITTTQAIPPHAVRVAPPALPSRTGVPGARTAPFLNFNVCERPSYPAGALRGDAQGTVVIVYTMETDGQITEASVERSAGPFGPYKELDEATLRAVRACKGIPGTIDGVPQRLSGRTEYVWQLEGAEKNVGLYRGSVSNFNRVALITSSLQNNFSVVNVGVANGLGIFFKCGDGTIQIAPNAVGRGSTGLANFLRFALISDLSGSKQFSEGNEPALSLNLKSLRISLEEDANWIWEGELSSSNGATPIFVRTTFKVPTTSKVSLFACKAAERSFHQGLQLFLFQIFSHEGFPALLRK